MSRAEERERAGRRAGTLGPECFSLELFAALAALTPPQREAWVDRYVAGRKLSAVQRTYLGAAKAKLQAGLAGAL